MDEGRKQESATSEKHDGCGQRAEVPQKPGERAARATVSPWHRGEGASRPAPRDVIKEGSSGILLAGGSLSANEGCGHGIVTLDMHSAHTSALPRAGNQRDRSRLWRVRRG